LIESIAIGSFDGVHIAHQKLIELADAVVVIERFSATLTPGWKRSLYIDKPCFFYLLEHIQGYTPREFIEHLALDFPNLKTIVVGYDFYFGKNKAGSIETLKRYFEGEVIVVPEVKYTY
jgi:riboflavin kinase/FMN adenylyltransferase